MGEGPRLITQTILSLLGQDAGTWIPPRQWDRSPCKLQVRLCLSPYPPHVIYIAFPTPSTWHVMWNSTWVPTEPRALPTKASCSSPCSCRGEPRAHHGVQGAGPNQAFCGEHPESGPSTVRGFGVQTTLADNESCRNLQMGDPDPLHLQPGSFLPGWMVTQRGRFRGHWGECAAGWIQGGTYMHTDYFLASLTYRGVGRLDLGWPDSLAAG